VIVVAASRLALVFPKLPFGGLPLITGYMIVGCLCGPYILGLVSKPQIPDLSYVTQTALAFIAFSAGSELYLPELRSLLRTILAITGANALFSYIFCTLFIYAIAAGGVVPWMTPYMGSCAFSMSMVAGSIMVARSPASAIAVVRELRAKGPATSIMLGVTVVGDVVVLILFTISTSFALAMCSGGGLDGGALVITLLTLVVAVGVGYGLGFVLIFLLWVPRVPARLTILPLGFLIFCLCDWLVIWTEEHWSVHTRISFSLLSPI
jgi:Kef-type K+ transport system membrane component KefB